MIFQNPSNVVHAAKNHLKLSLYYLCFRDLADIIYASPLRKGEHNALLKLMGMVAACPCCSKRGNLKDIDVGVAPDDDDDDSDDESDLARSLARRFHRPEKE